MIKVIELLAIGKATDNTTPTAVIKVKIDGAPINNISFNNLTIAVPKFIKIDKPEGWNLSAENVLTRETLLINTTTGDFVELLTLPIEGLQNIAIANNKITLDDEFSISGNASIAAGTNIGITSEALASSIVITPSVAIDDIKITKIVGHLDFDMSYYIEPQTIDLGSITEALGEDTEIDLNLTSPDLCLTVVNPVGIPIQANLKITPYKNDVAQTDAVVNSGVIAIQPADESGSVTTKLLISGNADAQVEGFTKVYVENLAGIINTLPDKFVVEIVMNTDQTVSHTLVMQDKYTFNVAFDVKATLSFGEGDGSIVYHKVIEDIKLDNIPDVGNIPKASVAVKSTSTLPLDLSLALNFLDAEGNAVTGITTTSTGKIEGSNDNTPKTATTTISLEFADGNISPLSKTTNRLRNSR